MNVLMNLRMKVNFKCQTGASEAGREWARKILLGSKIGCAKLAFSSLEAQIAGAHHTYQFLGRRYSLAYVFHITEKL